MQQAQECQEELIKDRPELAYEYFSYAADLRLAPTKKGRQVLGLPLFSEVYCPRSSAIGFGCRVKYIAPHRMLQIRKTK
jgi:hypothetical protein